MVDRDAAFPRHLLQLTGAHPVLATPPHGPEDDLTLEGPPLEVVHRSAAVAPCCAPSLSPPRPATEPSNALWDLANRTGQVATIAGLAYLTPLFGLLLLALFGAAQVSWITAVGAPLIVAGALAASQTKLPSL